MACLLPSGGRRQILRLSLLKKQDLSSTPSRAKTVLTCAIGISETCVKKIFAFSAASAVKPFDQKYQIMQNKPNFQNIRNVITLVYTMTNNNE
jgi:hypothetical protein